MCGIVGIFAPEFSASDMKSAVEKMRESLRHRGPDGTGLFVNDEVALGHTRLSIIDIEGGHQPICNEDGTIQLVINGEIYNYKSLQQEILSHGHHLRTKSDSEVIVHLYEEDGESCLEKLDGMFAFALWDNRKRKLFLARDRFGIKPLYFTNSKGPFCFASELTAFVQSGLVKAEVDSQALYAYIAFSYVPGPLSILKGIRKVQPAEKIVVQKGSVRKDIYWKPRHVKVPRKKNLAAEELAGRLKNCVQSHLVSDVPVAAFLSGGVDSSGIVAMAQTDVKMESFCVSFPNTTIDEAPVARKVAHHLGSNHHEVNIKINPVSLINDVINFMDEPFADSSALPTFAVCREARRVAKVVLSGDGGDEVFGGYTGRYRVAALKAIIPKPRKIAQGLRCLPPWRNGHRTSLPEMLEFAALPDDERYILERQITSKAVRVGLFGHSLSAEYEPVLRKMPSRSLKGFPHEHPVHRALWVDIKTSLADDMLVKVDRMSMAHGLEVRVPLLDHRLVEFAFSLPPNWLVSPFPVEGKRLLRKVIAPYLPLDILNRQKQGFVVPLNDWIKNHFISMFDTFCLGQGSYLAGLLDEKAILKLRHKNIRNVPRQDLYALLILELWLRRINLT